MPSLTNLLIVCVVAFAAPFLLGLFPGVRLPSVVLEIVAGIVVGPSALGLVEADQAVAVVALIGLTFVLFLAGLEIDFSRLRGPVLRLTLLGFGLSFGLAVAVSLGLSAAGLVDTPLLVAIILCATSLGVLVPVLKESVLVSVEIWTGDKAQPVPIVDKDTPSEAGIRRPGGLCKCCAHKHFS